MLAAALLVKIAEVWLLRTNQQIWYLKRKLIDLEGTNVITKEVVCILE